MKIWYRECMYMNRCECSVWRHLKAWRNTKCDVWSCAACILTLSFPQKPYYTNRPNMQGSAPRVPQSSTPRSVPPTHVYQPTSQVMMIPQQQLPFTNSQGHTFFLHGQVTSIILLTAKLCSFFMIVQLSNTFLFSIVVPAPLHAPDPAILCIQWNCRLLCWKQSSWISYIW